MLQHRAGQGFQGETRLVLVVCCSPAVARLLLLACCCFPERLAQVMGEAFLKFLNRCPEKHPYDARKCLDNYFAILSLNHLTGIWSGPARLLSQTSYPDEKALLSSQASY
ncbi:hypothetical protein BO71DRAFT_55529 [Aspergillus ellipticus CBS 707.79]|uniref:Uncharacterized protein n=1 Tax=Aspergillus ellipticus CBS 707.79 TaxID=1448320 RepID=A0A319DSZ0_9EURO|nr:hypothetical protein BO71DRAFT_55529 [Aspergillus ellipticus CBS 707.79]